MVALRESSDLRVVLLGWNRDNRETWPIDAYEDARQRLMRGKHYVSTWSVGRHRNIAVGLHCFLVVQGTKYPRGIVGIGNVMSEPFEDDHFDGLGGTTNYIEIDWKELLPLDDVIPLRELLREVPDGPWTKGFRQSGHPLRGQAAEQLLNLWKNRTPEGEEPGAGEIPEGEYVEGAVRTVKMNRYERDPRARLLALEHHGYTCAVCDLDPVTIYGTEIGRRVIHVHHITPMAHIGGEYQLDPINDLIPLCPNCHNAIHKLNPVPRPDEFRSRITQRP